MSDQIVRPTKDKNETCAFNRDICSFTQSGKQEFVYITIHAMTDTKGHLIVVKDHNIKGRK